MDYKALAARKEIQARAIRDLRDKRKLTTEEVKEIIRKSSKNQQDDEAPYADVPSAQPPFRPFYAAPRVVREDAAVGMGRGETTNVIVVQQPEQRFVQREPRMSDLVSGEGYMRAVMGNGMFNKGKKAKPVRPVDRINRVLW